MTRYVRLLTVVVLILGSCSRENDTSELDAEIFVADGVEDEKEDAKEDAEVDAEVDGGSCPAGSEAPTTIIGSVEIGGLRLSLIADSAIRVLGEPPSFDLVLTNVGDAPKRYFKNELDLEGGALIVEWLRGGTTKEQYCSYGATEWEASPRTLAAGESVAKELHAYWGSVHPAWGYFGCIQGAQERLPFGLVGDYSIRVSARLHVGDGDGEMNEVALTTAPIVLRITQPSSIDDDAWAGCLSASHSSDHVNEAYLFLLWQGGDQLLAGIESWTRVVEDYGGSVFEPYGHFALGRRWSEPFSNYGTGVVRPAEPALALEHMQKALSGFGCNETIWRRSTLYWMARMHATLGETATARQLVHEIDELYGADARNMGGILQSLDDLRSYLDSL